MHHTFLYIALLFMHDYDVKLSNCMFYGTGKQAKAKFSFSFGTWIWFRGIKLQAPVVQKRDSAIHRINRYQVDIAIGFLNTYPLDSDLSSG